MLKPAILYENQVIQAVNETWFTEKNRIITSNYYSSTKIYSDTWNNHQFVSINTKGELQGLIEYGIDRGPNNAYGLLIVNFTDNIFPFALDLKQALQNIFEQHDLNKLSFSLYCGNPAEEHYDRIIKKRGGRVVGIQYDHIKLPDGTMTD